MDVEYQKVKVCEQCGKKFWKGYFMTVPSEISGFEVTKVVCWRCRFLKPSKDLKTFQSREPQT